MQIRAINFLTSHALAFWKYINTLLPADVTDEARWLLDVSRGMGATHIIIPTESLHFPQSGFTMDKLEWLVNEVQSRGMTAVVWGDKWWLARTATEAIGWWEQVVNRFGNTVVYNLSQEIDLMWDEGASLQRSAVLERVRSLVQYLQSRGVPAESIWAGGATRLGTMQIASTGVGVLTYTMYKDVHDILVSEDATFADAEEFLFQSMKAIRARTHLPLVLVEFGHYTTWGGEALQKSVLELCIRAAKQAGCLGVGLWTLVDFWNCEGPGGWCGLDNNSYGVIGLVDSGAQPKSGLSAVADNWQ